MSCIHKLFNPHHVANLRLVLVNLDNKNNFVEVYQYLFRNILIVVLKKTKNVFKLIVNFLPPFRYFF